MAHTEYCFSSEGDMICAPGCTHDREEAQAAAHKKLVEEVAHWRSRAIAAEAALAEIERFKPTGRGEVYNCRVVAGIARRALEVSRG